MSLFATSIVFWFLGTENTIVSLRALLLSSTISANKSERMTIMARNEALKSLYHYFVDIHHHHHNVICTIGRINVNSLTMCVACFGMVVVWCGGGGDGDTVEGEHFGVCTTSLTLNMFIVTELTLTMFLARQTNNSHRNAKFTYHRKHRRALFGISF